MELAGLCAVAFVHEDEDLAFGMKVFRKMALDVLQEGVNVALFGRANFWISEQINHSSLALSVPTKSAPFLCSVDILVDAVEDLFDLLVQFRAVSDDQHPTASHMLANPLRQPHHGQALSAALGVPNDAAFPTLHAFVRRLYPEVLGCGGISS